jgi:hypothetical protein
VEANLCRFFVLFYVYICIADGIPGSAFGTDTKMGVVGGVKPVNEILIIGTPMAIQI